MNIEIKYDQLWLNELTVPPQEAHNELRWWGACGERFWFRHALQNALRGVTKPAFSSLGSGEAANTEKQGHFLVLKGKSGTTHFCNIQNVRVCLVRYE